MVRGQRRWWREMIYQHGDGQDRAVLLKQTPPGFLGSLNFANAVCVRSLEMGWVGMWPSSLQARSLCEWLFRGALTCAGAWGKCQCEPTSIQPRTCRISLGAAGARCPHGCCREVGVSLLGHLELGASLRHCCFFLSGTCLR